MRRAQAEAGVHKAILNYLRMAMPGAVIHHSPNEIGLSGTDIARTIHKAKSSGMMVGWPDFEVFHAGRVWFFEVKAARGRLSPAQAECHAALRAQGFDVHLVRSVDDAAAAIGAPHQTVATIPFRGIVT